jgi:hypothetical protein
MNKISLKINFETNDNFIGIEVNKKFINIDFFVKQALI